VVIIAGSGPTDRDGNSPGGVGADTYKLLARGLADAGIATFRYDKRGLASTKGTFDMSATTLADFAADAAAAARLIDSLPESGPVFLLGHSEGGTLALIAATAGAPVRGLILVATAGRDPTTILREQLGRQLSPTMLAQFDTAWAGYLRGDTAIKYPPALAPLFVPVNRRFMVSWQETRPVDLLRRDTLPVLVLQGETDVQITPEDARLLAAARPDITLMLLSGVNHVLKEATGSTAMAQMAAYTDRSLPLAPRVVPAIVDWIRTVLR
jgi:alpha-beta hydrolase superfamily lysophospholipase